MLVTVAIFAVGLMGLSTTGLSFFADIPMHTALLIAFALSFSSTVFAVKILEESGRSEALNGRTAIGVLIVQDIFAVLFLTFSTGKMPTPWALLVLGMLPVADGFSCGSSTESAMANCRCCSDSSSLSVRGQPPLMRSG